MPVSVLKIVPTAVVLVASASATWPYVELGVSSAPASARAKPGATAAAGPEIALALLHPTIGPRPLRDPFLDGDALQTEARHKIGKTMKDLLDEHRKRVKEKTVSKRPTASSVAKAANAATVVDVDPVAGLVLTGTVASGSHGIAMINGKSYKTGESVSASGAADPVVLEEVKRDQIVLRHKGRSFTLTYVVRSKREGAGDLGDGDFPRSAPAKKAGSARGKAPPGKVSATKKS
jgi:hypothetical protein